VSQATDRQELPRTGLVGDDRIVAEHGSKFMRGFGGRPPAAIRFSAALIGMGGSSGFSVPAAPALVRQARRRSSAGL